MERPLLKLPLHDSTENYFSQHKTNKSDFFNHASIPAIHHT